MRRRYVLALVLATALIFALAGYYARTLRDDNPSAADCEAAINYFETVSDFLPDGELRTELVPEAGKSMRAKCSN